MVNHGFTMINYIFIWLQIVKYGRTIPKNHGYSHGTFLVGAKEALPHQFQRLLLGSARVGNLIYVSPAEIFLGLLAQLLASAAPWFESRATNVKNVILNLGEAKVSHHQS